jgi:hypothetical protein
MNIVFRNPAPDLLSSSPISKRSRNRHGGCFGLAHETSSGDPDVDIHLVSKLPCQNQRSQNSLSRNGRRKNLRWHVVDPNLSSPLHYGSCRPRLFSRARVQFRFFRYQITTFLPSNLFLKLFRSMEYSKQLVLLPSNFQIQKI